MNVKDLFEDALPIITKFAPTLANAIGGPVAIAAGYVIPVLANSFSSNPNDVKQLVQTIVSDPLAKDKLEQAEKCHGNWINYLTSNLGQLSSADVSIKLTWK